MTFNSRQGHLADFRQSLSGAVQTSENHFNKNVLKMLPPSFVTPSEFSCSLPEVLVTLML